MSTTTVVPPTPDPTPPTPAPEPNQAPDPVTTTATAPESVGQAAEQVVADVQSDIAATEQAVTTDVVPLWQQARAEYDALEPAAQGRIHQLFNDLEVAYASAMPALHTFLGAK